MILWLSYIYINKKLQGNFTYKLFIKTHFGQIEFLIKLSLTLYYQQVLCNIIRLFLILLDYNIIYYSLTYLVYRYNSMVINRF